VIWGSINFIIIIFAISRLGASKISFWKIYMPSCETARSRQHDLIKREDNLGLSDQLITL
jgi:hypothetical protein